MNSLFIHLADKVKPQGNQLLVSITASLVLIALWVLSIQVIGFSFLIYAGMMSLVAVFTFMTPRAGLLIIILATMWFQHVFTLQPIIFGDSVIKLYPLDVIFLVTILGYMFQAAFAKKHKHTLLIKNIESGIFFFAVISFVYLLRGLASGQADHALVISAFKNYAFYAGLYFLTLYTVQKKEDIQLLLKTFIIGGLGIIFYVVAGLVLGEGVWVQFTPLSTEGVRYLSFAHAFYLCLVMLMTLILLVYKLRPLQFSIATLWIQLIGLVGSLMRHLWLSLFAVTAFLFVIIPKEAKKRLINILAKNAAVIVIVASLVGFLVVLFPLSDASISVREILQPISDRAASLTRSTYDASARWRIFAWRAAQESFLENPILGVGYGQDLVIDFDTYQQIIDIRELHNSLLVIVVQMGLIGSFVFLYILWQVLKMFVQAYQHQSKIWPYQLAFFCAFLLFLSASVWQPYFEADRKSVV